MNNELEEDFVSTIVDTDIEELTNFKLTPKIVKVEDVIESTDVVEKTTEESFEVDFDYIRNNLKDIINMGSVSLQNMISIASESEHPRAYEVVATMMKALADINKDLLAAHKTRDDRTVVKGGSTTNVQNNTVFVGSTAEFSKLLKQRTKDIDNDEARND